MASASSVGPPTAATMEATCRAAAVSTAAGYMAACIGAATIPAVAESPGSDSTSVGATVAAATTVGAAITISATIAVSAAVAVSAAITPSAAVPAVAPAPAIPGTSANEDAADKPVRAVIAIRRTGIGIIGIVAPLANWRPVLDRSRDNVRSNPYANSDLGVRSDCERHR